MYPPKLRKNKRTMNTPLMVTIRCTVYNHEPYIRECLEGFVMQKTNFRFEAIVHDDASTDGSAAIIREYAEKYPDIIKPIYQTENQYSKRDGSLRRIMNEHTHGKYVALCEGDDYWIDPLKLQKQVDFLEANDNISLCHTAFRYLYQSTGEIRETTEISNRNMHILGKNSRKNLIYEILNSNKYRIQTNTAVFRRVDYEKIIQTEAIRDNYFLMGDTPLWVSLLQFGEIKFIDSVMAVYRVNEGSACRQTDMKKQTLFALSSAEMRLYYANLNDLSPVLFLHQFNCLYIKCKSFNPNYDLSKSPIFNLLETNILFSLLDYKIVIHLIKSACILNKNIRAYVKYIINNLSNKLK